MQQGEADPMSSKNRVTVNLSDSEAAQLAQLAERAKVSKAWLGRQAICSLLEQTLNENHQIPLPLLAAEQKGKL
jgi:predicted transcriptional regulator